jgi:hypothetical protein
MHTCRNYVMYIATDVFCLRLLSAVHCIQYDVHWTIVEDLNSCPLRYYIHHRCLARVDRWIISWTTSVYSKQIHNISADTAHNYVINDTEVLQKTHKFYHLKLRSKKHSQAVRCRCFSVMLLTLLRTNTVLPDTSSLLQYWVMRYSKV